MANHTWQAANGGVLLWEPAREAVIIQREEEQPQPDEPDLPSSHDCKEEEEILPSIEDVFISPRIKSEPSQDSLMFDSSSSSLSLSDIQNSSPIVTSPCSSSASEIHSNSLYGQLKKFAITPARDKSEISETKAHSKSSEYEPKSVDVQLTPCPTRLSSKNASRNLLKSDKESHHSNRGAAANSSRRVRRILNFKMKRPSLLCTPAPRSNDSRRVQRRSTSRSRTPSDCFTTTPRSNDSRVQKGSISKKTSLSSRSTPTPRSKELSNIESLEALRNIERPPGHLWDEDERALLTILYRWYDSTDIWIIPQVFNKITSLDLPLRSIRYQFKSHILLFGGRAFPEFARVMAVPFHDPEGKYKDVHQIIEEATIDLGVELPRRKVEENLVSGMARYAKSPRTRRTYRSLVRRAVERERDKARMAKPCVAPQQPCTFTIPKQLLGHKALVLSTENEAQECWMDVEGSVDHCQPSPELTKRTIAFRVWSAKSWTIFSKETGFISQAFENWRGEYPPPFSPEDQGQQAIMVLMNSHLSMKGGASTFVSLCTSLLQALVKASVMEDPQIAVVALNHPLLTAPNKTLPVADVLQMLKAEGQAWWAHYKGYAERMVWASVPASTILSHFPISKLCDLADSDEVCAQILNLHEFRRGRKTRYVSKAMRKRKNTITPTTARAMGAIARTFGMHRENVGLEHIQGLIAALVDSFQLARSSDDCAYDEDVAYAFAKELRSRRYSVEDVKEAFEEGVRKGREIVGYYASRRKYSGGKDGKD